MATQAQQAVQRAAINQAREDWKRFIASLQALNANLRRGAVPHDYPDPGPPSTDPNLCPDLYKKAMALVEKQIPVSRQVAYNLATGQEALDAASRYAAGYPTTSTPLPEGQAGANMLPQEMAQQDFPGAIPQNLPGAPAPKSKMKTLLMVAGIALAAYFAWKFWKGRKR